jgi:hypothetical protein
MSPSINSVVFTSLESVITQHSPFLSPDFSPAEVAVDIVEELIKIITMFMRDPG